MAGLQKGLLFPSTTGTYRSPQILVKPLQRCGALAGGDKMLTAHCMRRTTKNLLRQAAGGTVARATIGHATEEMTRLDSEVDRHERAPAHAAAFRGACAEKVGLSGGVFATPPENGDRGKNKPRISAGFRTSVLVGATGFEPVTPTV